MRLRDENEALMETLVRAKVELAETQGEQYADNDSSSGSCAFLPASAPPSGARGTKECACAAHG